MREMQSSENNIEAADALQHTSGFSRSGNSLRERKHYCASLSWLTSEFSQLKRLLPDGSKIYTPVILIVIIFACFLYSFQIDFPLRGFDLTPFLQVPAGTASFLFLSCTVSFL